MTQRERQILSWIEEDPLISQQELAKRAGITRSSVAVHISHLMRKGYIAGKGYLVRTAPYVAVVGGANLDIGGWPAGPLRQRDSNPGRVGMSFGGVGRNIAHNLALLGVDVRLATVFGDDLNAQKLTDSCARLGIDLTASQTVAGERTSTYLFVNDAGGDMALALSDMEIYRHMTPQFLARRQKLLDGARLVVTDTNPPAQTLAYLAEHAVPPVFCDPVSTAKAEKLRPILGKLHTLKPNRLEAELLSGVAITDEGSLEQATQALLETGLQRVFLSLGEEGVYAASGRERVRLPALPARRVNTTGCGDAFMAAIGWAYLQGLDLAQTAQAGLAAAALAMESGETINPEMSEEALKTHMAAHGTDEEDKEESGCKPTI